MADTNFGSVVLQMPFNGANNGTTFTETSMYNLPTIIGAGAPITSTSQSKFYGSSGYFDGSSSLVIPGGGHTYYPNGTDFTIECWINSQTTSGTYNAVLANTAFGSNSTYPDNTWKLGVRFNSTNDFSFTYRSGNVWYNITGGGNVNDSTWHHVAATRASGTIYLFVDGILKTTSTGHTRDIGYLVNSFIIGYQYADGVYYTGYINDVRITKGLARYTSNFTPPTQLCKSISGVIRDDNNATAIRTVYSIPRVGLTNRGTASASDGTFSLTVGDTPQDIIALDDTGGLYHNDLIYSRVYPG